MFRDGANDDQLKALFDAALDALVGMDAGGRTIAWNAQAEKSFRWSAAEALGRPLSELIIPLEFRQAHADGLAHYLATGEGPVLNKRIEVTAMDRSGRQFPVELTIIPLEHDGDQVFYAFVRDIERRKTLEAKLNRRASESQILYDASLLVSHGGSFEDIFRSCLQTICETSGWDLGHVYLVNDRTRHIEPTDIWQPADNPMIEPLRPFAFARGDGLPGRIWQSGEPEYITDIERREDFPRRKIMLGHGVRSAFAFPVFVDGRVSAVLEFFSTSERIPDDEQLDLVRTLGLQLGQVLERQQAAEQERMLVLELNHRANNLMAVTASIFRQTLTHAATVDELGELFSSRLHSLSVATRLLSEGNWKTAPLHALVEQSLEPFQASARVARKGPDLRVAGRQVMTLSLVLHELATNAVKYGALQDGRGRVDLDWQLLELPAHGRALEFRWVERGGPAVAAPTTNGFGTTLLANLIGREPGGEMEPEFDPDGFRIRFRLPVMT